MYEDVPDSDEEMSIGHGSPSDISAASSQELSSASHASGADISSAEVLSRATPAAGGLEQGHTGRQASGTSSQADNGNSKAAGDEPTNADSNDDETVAADLGNGSHIDRADPDGSNGVSETGQQSEAELLSCASRRNDHQPARPSTEAGARLSQHSSDAQHSSHAPVDNHSQNSNLLQEPTPAVSASMRNVAQVDGSLLGCGKRKAATVFDHGIAEQAEAADLNAGIVAGGIAANTDGQPIESGVTEKASADVSDSTAKPGACTRQACKLQSRTAPWR